MYKKYFKLILNVSDLVFTHGSEETKALWKVFLEELSKE